MQQFRVPDWFQLDSSKLEKLRSYQEIILKWNKSVNLISRPSEAEVDRVHLADSILGVQVCIPHLSKFNEVFDLGSGNGLPGVVLSLLEPEISVVCIDSDERKMAFISQVAVALGLKNLRSQVMRVENLHRNEVSACVTRGLGSIEKVLSLIGENLPQTSHIFHFKGLKFEEEIAGAEKSLEKVWNCEKLGLYTLPPGSSGAAETRTIIKTTKL